MPLTDYSNTISVTTLFDTDAQAFFDRVDTAGGSLSATEKTAVNQLVLDLKGYSIWSAMKAIYPMVGASAAACAQNLKSSSFTGTFSSGWTFASTGVTPNGTSAYMDTNLNASSQLSTPSHLSYYTGTNGNTGLGQVDIGITQFFLSLWYNADGLSNIIARNQSTTLLDGGTVTDSRGFGIATKFSTTSKIFMNNVQKTSITDTATGYQNFNIPIGCFNQSSGRILFTNRDCRFSSIGDGLNDTQAGNLYTAVNTFQTTLSRNV